MKTSHNFFFLLLVAFSTIFIFSCTTTSAVKGTESYQIDGLNLKPVVPQSTDFLVRYAANLIPETIIKNENALSAMSADDSGRAALLAETGKNYVMYANAFIQHNAQMLPLDRFDEQNAEFKRAKAFYLRGRDYVLESLELKYPGMKTGLISGGEAKAESAAKLLQKKDVESAYWCGAGWLGGFSLDPLDSELLGSAPSAVALLKYAVSLEPDFNNGAIWDVLCAYYAAAPGEMGGSDENAIDAYKKSILYSGGNAIGPYITYAQSICVPAMDEKEFVASLQKGLNTKKPAAVTDKVAYTISREKALWLLEHKEDYFINWDD